MLTLKFIFTRFLSTMVELCTLQKANYYGEDFATIEMEQDGKLYTISMRSEDVKKENDINE